jgi:hypothetical protein
LNHPDPIVFIPLVVDTTGHLYDDFLRPECFDVMVVFYESRRELKIRLMNEGRCDERLNARVEESTCLTYTGLHDKTTRNT